MRWLLAAIVVLFCARLDAASPGRLRFRVILDGALARQVLCELLGVR
jgi:hypothetical protein